MGKKANIFYIVLFLAFIGVFFVLGLALPKRDFSPRENRQLQTAPEFSVKSLLSGEFTKLSEDYVTDQFPFRDSWITMKAGSELAIGKDFNNGVYLCDNDTLIEPFAAPDRAELDERIDAINALCENSGLPVYFALIPTASELWGDMLPEGAPNDSEADVIDYVYSALDCGGIDVLSALAAHRDEDIFYRTDHHWTTLGAYYGYEAVARAMGLTPAPLDSYEPKVVTDSFLGTTYSSSGFSWVEPDSISTYVPQGDAVIERLSGGAATEIPLYDQEFLALKDKYSYFYGGNAPLLRVKTGVEGAGRLLILRDSYMDSMSPYMFGDFSEIHIMDLRYYNLSVADYIRENGIDSVLVCYSVTNFCEDNFVRLAAY